MGCGEGDLLRVLCEPAPWLTPPPPDVLPPPSGSSSSSDPISPSPTYNDEVPNLHAIHLHGLDISASDLEFAVKTTTPFKEAGHEEGSSYRLYAGIRWEDLKVALWKGGLEVFNEEFVDVECIVSTEVIEHLSQDILPAFAPMLLGVYHPRLLLVTTPSYTFNARFTAPTAPPSARKGYPDPTGRSDRIFRHDDHKFEWTVEEFQTWCHKVAHEWGYEVHISSIGRAMEIDAWGRDDELGGATSVAIFKRLEDETREARSREVLNTLQLPGGPHELLANHQHIAHPSSRKPKPLKEIGDVVQAKMEEFREAFMMVEELWFERDIGIACGGWIEFLIRAAEESDFLVLKRDGEDIKNQKRWIIELVGGVANQVALWPIEGDRSLDYIPANWVPEEGETESSEGEWGLGSTDMEGDVSWNGSEEEDNVEKSESSSWTSGRRGMLNESEKDVTANHGWNEVESYRIPHSSGSPTTGWDGDESDDTT